MARKQTLALRKGVPIVIDTPEGPIRIWKPEAKQNRGKVIIELPGDSAAFVGEERGRENSRFYQWAEDGRMVPSYSVLTPRKDERGCLVGVDTQQPMRVGASSDVGALKIRIASG